jgi:hypothetical protein
MAGKVIQSKFIAKSKHNACFIDIISELPPYKTEKVVLTSGPKHGRHVHVRAETELIPYLQRGWSIRMSAPDIRQV